MSRTEALHRQLEQQAEQRRAVEAQSREKEQELTQVEGEIARDPLLPDVAWSWLTESLEGCAADYSALGGTVTATSSVRFGDISGSERSDDVEIRASWTALPGQSSRHLAAFAALLAVAAGLPPEGVSAISPIRPV